MSINYEAFVHRIDKSQIPACNIMGVNIAAIDMDWLLQFTFRNIREYGVGGQRLLCNPKWRGTGYSGRGAAFYCGTKTGAYGHEAYHRSRLHERSVVYWHQQGIPAFFLWKYRRDFREDKGKAYGRVSPFADCRDVCTSFSDSRKGGGFTSHPDDQ